MNKDMQTYLVTGQKQDCMGCEACKQVCPVSAIVMKVDCEGFRYPSIDENKCIHCGLCQRVCPLTKNLFNQDKQLCWGGSHLDESILRQSTSGGAFSAIAHTFLSNDKSVVWGCAACEDNCLKVEHICIDDINELYKLRKSKYVQSHINNAFKTIKSQLLDGFNVLFSGTPCQAAALKSYLQVSNVPMDNLLLVEVMCEGVPAPRFIEKYVEFLQDEKQEKVVSFDWRYKNGSHWDFEFMRAIFENGKYYKIARWFNPFWNIWLRHLMTRPSCYNCVYATDKRVSDITIADLWGVHIYCPDLYANNKGASLVIANSDKGISFWNKAKSECSGHNLDLEDVIRYQGPMRGHINYNQDRDEFMSDLTGQMGYKQLVDKWYEKPTLKLLFNKYVWGNRQKVALWKLKHFNKTN